MKRNESYNDTVIYTLPKARIFDSIFLRKDLCHTRNNSARHCADAAQHKEFADKVVAVSEKWLGKPRGHWTCVRQACIWEYLRPRDIYTWLIPAVSRSEQLHVQQISPVRFPGSKRMVRRMCLPTQAAYIVDVWHLPHGSPWGRLRIGTAPQLIVETTSIWIHRPDCQGYMSFATMPQ